MLNKLNLQLFAMDEEETENNPFANFEDFVSQEEEDDSADEQMEEAEDEEQEEVEEEQQEELEETPKQKKQDKPKKEMSKTEYALVQAKKENKSLKEVIKSLDSRLANIEKSESERSLERKKKDLVATYIDKGFDEDEAEARASEVIEKDVLKNDIQILKTQLQELLGGQQSSYDAKVQTEQSLLYKQAKAQRSKVDATTAGTTVEQTFKMTPQQKKDWEAIQRTPWGKSMSKKDFLKSWQESFGN